MMMISYFDDFDVQYLVLAAPGKQTTKEYANFYICFEITFSI